MQLSNYAIYIIVLLDRPPADYCRVILRVLRFISDLMVSHMIAIARDDL